MTRTRSPRESAWNAVPGPLGAGPRPLRAALNRSIRPLARLMAEVSLRALDVGMALAGLLALSPFLLLRAIIAKARVGKGETLGASDGSDWTSTIHLSQNRGWVGILFECDMGVHRHSFSDLRQIPAFQIVVGNVCSGRIATNATISRISASGYRTKPLTR